MLTRRYDGYVSLIEYMMRIYIYIYTYVTLNVREFAFLGLILGFFWIL